MSISFQSIECDRSKDFARVSDWIPDWSIHSELREPQQVIYFLTAGFLFWKGRESVAFVSG